MKAALSFSFLLPLLARAQGNTDGGLPPKITAASITPSYDADACGSSWISYVRDDVVSTAGPWYQLNRELSAWTAKYVLSSWEETTTEIETVPKTLWKQMPTQCDQFPRVSSTGETVELSTDEKRFWAVKTIAGSPPRPSALSYIWGYKPSKPYPVCEIRPIDCQKQWNLLQLAFQNGSLGLDTIGNSSMLDINFWIVQRKYTLVRDFFSRCPQPRDICADDKMYGGDKPDDLHLSVWYSQISTNKLAAKIGNGSYVQDIPPCYVKGERFVLIHFAPVGNVSKVLCERNTQDFGDRVSNITGSLSNAMMIAITDKIVFPAKTKMAYNGLDDEELFYLAFGGTGAPSTVTIPASTMTNPELWTFTSPSAYLAYDKIYATGDCSHPGKILQDGILTLAPSEVRTMTRICGPSGCGQDRTGITSAKEVDFADLQGPIAASAYFELASGPMGRQIVWPDECRWNTTICPELFFPQLTLPKIVTNLEPAWSTCIEGYYGNYIWDPPLVLNPTLSVRPASITIKTEGSTFEEATNAAQPGLMLSSPNAPATPTAPPQYGVDYQSQTGSSHSIISTALVAVGSATITVSILPDETNLQIGSQILHLSGPPLTVAGVAFSFGANGRLEVIRSPSFTATGVKTTLYRPEKTAGPSKAGTPASTNQNGRPEFGGPFLIDGDEEDTPTRPGTNHEKPETEVFTLGHGRRKSGAVSGVSLAIPTCLAALVFIALIVNS